MKGNIVKRDKGDWVVWFTDLTSENGLRILPLYPDDVKQIDEWSKVFDNIEARIASDPEVEFEIIPCIPKDLEPTRGETLSFEAVKYARLIHNGTDLKDWDVTLIDGLADEFVPGLDKKTLDELFEAHEPEDFIQDCVDKDFENRGINSLEINKELLIELEDWDHRCGDGCCYTYGVNIYINGEKIEDEDGTNPHQLLKAVLTKLGYTNVKVEYK